MPKNYGDYKQSVDEGLMAQKRFIDAFQKKYPNSKIRPSTKFEDSNRHIDVVCQRGNTEVTFDVKKQKKVNRSDNNLSGDFTWVELQNNYGGKGWAYGSEKYVALEMPEHFIIVERAKLLKLVIENKLDKIETENKNLPAYSQYKRAKYGNDDISVLTPYNDIYKIAHCLLEK